MPIIGTTVNNRTIPIVGASLLFTHYSLEIAIVADGGSSNSSCGHSSTCVWTCRCCSCSCVWLLSEGVEVIPEATITTCSYSRSQRKVVLGLSNGQSVGISHFMLSLSTTSV